MNPTVPAVRGLVERLWVSQRAVALQRVLVLEEFLVSAATGVATENCRAEAVDAAHKLSGALGMYGMPAAGELARRLEIGLGPPFSPSGQELRDLAVAVSELRNGVGA